MSDISAAVEAWDQWCDLLKKMGREVVAPPYPTGDGAELEMIEHLADNVEGFLGWEVFHADPTRPFFNRQNDLTVQWGGPNADNVYRHARIEPGRRYRITGNMHGCDDFIIALRAGFMHNDIWGTKATITAHDLGPRPPRRLRDFAWGRRAQCGGHSRRRAVGVDTGVLLRLDRG